MESCIVYFSRAAEPFEAQLSTLLEQSRIRNAQLGITGIMLYVRGSIIQVLEGDQQQVEAMYQRIQVDERHQQVECILNRPITQRLFTDWRMGYQTIDRSQLADIEAVVSLEPTESSGIPLVLRVIQTFFEANRHTARPPV
ncbi:BLUF domain-containing protein [Fibrella forsythiae]|uniref:BLUF domain-containing protein n=1 Tax=Fibrella forsythiae TaxID=2817061 RepID=A0ABS3JSZ2_9BACT|nr:BLUF domain-containing protein [Fibrella forsythiae]MBO0953133.1 BLUF domain-containing protein [Fibrella forsythiae]